MSLFLRALRTAASILILLLAFSTTLSRSANAAVPNYSTTTTLTLTSGGSTVTTVPAGTAITLTATITGSSGVINPGQVKFCDVTGGAPCTFLHILTTGQLTSAGTAAYKFVPGIGTHTYQAVFVGKPGGTTPSLASTSSAATLTVTGVNSTTAITQTGTQGNYTLRATVTGARPTFPTGTVSFQDTSNGNAVVGSASLVAGTASLSFTPQSATAGAYQKPAGVGDFTGDGILDLAVPNYVAKTVTILKGNGDGTFSTASTITLGNQPYFVVAGDFDGDGILDLAIAANGNASGVGFVFIYKGAGNGTFTNYNTLVSGKTPTSMIVGDFNRDGNLDIVTANQTDNTLSVFTGTGTGSFTSTATPATGTSPYFLVAADFNGDGILDLAVANDQTAGTLSILQGVGNGTFTALANVSTGNNPYGVAVGDFNGDGIADLATVNYGNQNVSILQGNGNGTFTALASLNTVSNGYYLIVGDFDGDGIADIAVNVYPNQTVYIYKGAGNGTFTTLASQPVALYTVSLAAGDFNGDGLLDLVGLAYNTGTTAQVLLNSGTATATATQTHIAPIGNGTDLIDAVYPGDTNYTASTSATTSLTDTPNTSISVTSVSPSTATVGTNVTLNATVVDTVNSATYPVGTVTFSTTVGGTTYTAGSANVVNGVASYVYDASYAGTNTVTAVFTPTNSLSFSSATDATGKPLTVTAVTPVQYDGTNDQTIQSGVASALIVIIGYPGTARPTGAITLTVNGSPLAGLGTPNCIAKSKHENCAYPYTTQLAPGSYTLVYNQAADANYNAVAGSSTLTISPPPMSQIKRPVNTTARTPILTR